MQARSLNVYNFCQFGMRSVVFQPGLTAIVGPNGSGKSNLLGAMMMALTGENPNVGVKTDNINQLADSTASSFVEFTFTHGSTSAFVTRYLRPDSKSKLELDGEVVARGDRKVNAAIFELLGVDADILRQLVIVSQTDMFGLLAKTTAERSKAFQRIFRTDAAEALWKLLGEHATTLRIPEEGAGLDSCRIRREEVTRELAAVTLEREQYGDLGLLRITRDRVRDAENSAERLHVLEGRVESMADDQAALVTHIEGVKVLRLEAYERVTELCEARDGNAEASAAASVALANREQATHVETARLQLQKRGVSVTCQLQVLRDTAPVEPAVYVEDTTELILRRAELNAEWIALGDFTATFTGEVGACPTCGADVATELFVERLTEATARLAELPALLELADEQLTTIRGYKADVIRNDAEVLRTREQLTELAMSEAALANVLDPPDDDAVHEFKTVLSDQEAYTRAIVIYQELVSEHDTQLAVDEREQATLARIQEEMVVERAQLAVILSERPEESLVYLDATISLVVDADTAINNKAGTVRHLDNRIENLESVQRAGIRARRWQEHVLAMRDVVHRDAAPRFVAQRNLQRLQSIINQQLEQFDTDYRVTAQEGLSFRADFPDGRSQPAERLSGGEQVILALALRIALNLMVTGDINFLALDEPTAFLDDHHIQGFEPVLGRLREYVASRGLQCLMVTHERRLAPMFDAVVELGP